MPQKSVLMIAPNVFERSHGLESHFNLLLRSGHLASFQNLFRLLTAPPGVSPQLIAAIKKTNPLSAYFLEGFLKARGIDVRVVFDPENAEELSQGLRCDPIAVAVSTTYITSNQQLATVLDAIRRAGGASLPIVVGGPYIWKQTQNLRAASGEDAEAKRRELRDFGVEPFADLLFSDAAPPTVREAIYVGNEHGEHTLLCVLKALEAPDSAERLEATPNLVLFREGAWRATPYEHEPVDLDGEITRWDLVSEVPEMVPLRSGTGCPHRCGFCDFVRLHRRFQMRSIDSLLREIRLARNRGRRLFNFVDDNIFVTKERARTIAEALLKSELGIIWGGFFRVDKLAESNVTRLRESGLVYGICGIESGDPGILRRMRKGLEPGHARRGIDLATAAGINLNLTFIVGYPGETRESLDNTIVFLDGLAGGNPGVVTYQLYPLVVEPGSPIDELEARREHSLHGRFDSWFHQTMSSEEAARVWSPYVFRQVHVSYDYYASDGLLFQDPAQRRAAMELRRQLTLAFMDSAPDDEVQRRFAALHSALLGKSQAGAPDWRSYLAPREEQPAPGR